MRRPRHVMVFVRMLWIVTAVLGGGGSAAFGATFNVNNTSDIVDANPADGLCQTLAGACTLRAAIQQANTLAGTDTIAVPGGTYTLALGGADEDAAATGDLDITQSVDIVATGNPTVDGAGLDRVFHVTAASAIVIIDGLTIVGGAPPLAENGGGILNTGILAVRRCLLAGNVTSQTLLDGGGGAIFDAGTLTLLDSVVTGNTAPDSTSAGVGVDVGATAMIKRTTIDSNVAGFAGGGVGSRGTLTIESSTISNNATAPSGFGAGLAVSGGTVTISNTTVSGNFIPTNPGSGGGMIALGGATVVMNNVTVASNDAGEGPSSGGGLLSSGATVQISNTLLSGNSAGSGRDCSGAITSAGFNLIEDATGCTVGGDLTGNVTGISANLGPLANNGGPTATHVPGFGSLVLDAGNNILAVGSGGSACAAKDQRGGGRPLGAGARCDIGATEVGCGNHFAESGEVCDSPCCDPTCSVPLSFGSSCQGDDLCTAAGTCDFAGLCTGGPPVMCACGVCNAELGCVASPPATGCRLPLAPKKSFFALKHGATPAKNAVIWKWGKGQQTLAADFGDPVDGTTDFELCGYDGLGNLVVGSVIPSGQSLSTCGIVPCWKTLANGNFKRSDTAGTPQGIRSLTLTPGFDAQARISLKGKGANLPFPVVPLSNPPLVVQLRRRDSPICWQAQFGFHVLKNKADGFTAQSD